MIEHLILRLIFLQNLQGLHDTTVEINDDLSQNDCSVERGGIRRIPARVGD